MFDSFCNCAFGIYGEKRERGRPSLAVLALQRQPLGSLLEIDENFGAKILNCDTLSSDIVTDNFANNDLLNISSSSTFTQAQSIETDLNQVIQVNPLVVILQENSQPYILLNSSKLKYMRVIILATIKLKIRQFKKYLYFYTFCT